MVIDGAALGAVVMASDAGGMDIEEVAERTPERILRAPVDPMLGFVPYQGRTLAYELKLAGGLARQAGTIIERLYTVFDENDCSLAEINPPGGHQGRAAACGGRQARRGRRRRCSGTPASPSCGDAEQEDPLEVEARKYDINYVKLDGSIGCIVNGAGLAMATMDVIAAAGTSPANFLDIGGGADDEKTAASLSLVLKEPKRRHGVRQHLRAAYCAATLRPAGFVLTAEREPEAMRPMVVRMLGANAEEGRQILAESGLEVTLVDDLNQAAEASRRRRLARRVRPKYSSRTHTWTTHEHSCKRDNRLLVQGITGKEGSYHAQRCMEYGAQLVAASPPAGAARRSANRCPSSTPSSRRSPRPAPTRPLFSSRPLSRPTPLSRRSTRASG